MTMFSFDWLVWFMAFLKKWLHDRVDAVVRECVDSPDVVGAVYRELFEDYVAVLRFAWFGAVLFQIAESRRQGAQPGFIPGWRGVSPEMVKRVLREELRVTKKGDGKGVVTGNLDDVVQRVSGRLGTFIPAVQRQTVDDCTNVSIADVGKVNQHREAFGHPLKGFVEEAEDAGAPLGRVFEENKSLRDEYERMKRDWRESVKVSPDGVLRSDIDGLDDEELEILGKQQRALYGAEIDLGMRESMPEGSDIDFAYRNVAWARVAVGSYTCGFCLMLCSRGAIYRSDTVLSAKNRARKGKRQFVGRWGLNAYHEHCDCMMVPVFDWDNFAGKDIMDGARKLWKQFSKDVKNKNGEWGNGALTPSWFSDWLKAHPELVAGMPSFDPDKGRPGK